jgi:hypothetical protein
VSQSTSDILVDRLIDYGVRDVFGLPGDACDPQPRASRDRFHSLRLGGGAAKFQVMSYFSGERTFTALVIATIRTFPKVDAATSKTLPMSTATLSSKARQPLPQCHPKPAAART